MNIREEQCNKVCRILDDVLANRTTERDSLIVAVRKAFESLEQFGNSEQLPPAQPELPDTNVGDPISRQAAISAICNACGKIDCDKMDKCEKLQLPPANCSEFPNNSDTADALHTSTDYFLDENYAGMLERTHRNWLESVLKMNDELDVASGKSLDPNDIFMQSIAQCLADIADVMTGGRTDD